MLNYKINDKIFIKNKVLTVNDLAPYFSENMEIVEGHISFIQLAHLYVAIEVDFGGGLMKMFDVDYLENNFNVQIIEDDYPIKIEKPEFSIHLSNLYWDITSIDITPQDSFKSTFDKFYEVMRQWGICQHTGNDRDGLHETGEWKMCMTIFKTKFNLLNRVNLFLVAPDDLKLYGKDS